MVTQMCQRLHRRPEDGRGRRVAPNRLRPSDEPRRGQPAQRNRVRPHLRQGRRDLENDSEGEGGRHQGTCRGQRPPVPAVAELVAGKGDGVGNHRIKKVIFEYFCPPDGTRPR